MKNVHNTDTHHLCTRAGTHTHLHILNTINMIHTPSQILSVLISSGCHKKASYSEWLRNSRNLFLIVLEVGEAKIKAPSGSVSWFITVFFSLYLHLAEGARVPSGISLIRRLIPSQGLCPHDLITSQRPHLLIQACWSLGFQYTNFDRTLHFVYDIEFKLKK